MRGTQAAAGRSSFLLAAVLASAIVVASAGCSGGGGNAGNGSTGRGGSSGGQAAGHGGSGPGGSIGGDGGGTGGVAGSIGDAGTGGATAGTTGSAGTGGTAGSAGTGGAAAGTTGTAGAGGATGGTTGSAGSAGGGAGTSGNAGAGAGGTGGTGGTGGATGGTGGVTGIGGFGGFGGGITATCGNGIIELGETCDDHNRTVGDGCGYLCQIEADWQCPTPGSPCTLKAVCGDGLLAAREICDDGNTASGDGCSADCQTVEAGWRCPGPGLRCLPLCGNGVITAGEQCDDGNTTDGDGCSSICLFEPGATCTGTPSVCSKPVCGNGVKEGNEACDCGTSTGSFPAGCGGPNGLFFGDGSGCSRACTREPTCRSAGGVTQACASTCGNGSIETGEACDDGNRISGDGCSATCTIEPGFGCAATLHSDGESCQGGSGQCLHLPAIVRDFKNESVTGGHPDFFYLGAPVANPVTIMGVEGQTGSTSYNKRYCVPDAAGPAKQQDVVNRSWDLAAATLGTSGKPTFNAARTNGTLSECQFIDWSHDTNGGHVPGYAGPNSPLAGLVYVNGAAGHPMYRGLAPMVTSSASFAQWFVDSAYTGNTHTVTSLEMIGGIGNRFQFSPSPHVTYGGFFPLDPPGQFPFAGGSTGPGAIRMVGSEAMQCNIWPYWYSSTLFGAGAGCRGDQYLFPPSVDGALYPTGRWLTNVQGWFHDFWFTTEIHTTFVYGGTFSLDVAATDDFFAFINGTLVVDLGGTHQRIPAHVEIGGLPGLATITEGGRADPVTGSAPTCPSADPYTGLFANGATNSDGNNHTNCTTASCDCRARTVGLGLELGRTYELAMFAANRHCPEYNITLGMSGPGGNVSACQPRCGDGLRSAGEQCDCGDTTASTDPSCRGMTNSGSGYCNTQCKLGPSCGDGFVDSSEECDLGAKNNTSSYGGNGCTPGCRFPHFCGDGILDAWAGEQCDRGTSNGTAGSPCSVICRIATP